MNYTNFVAGIPHHKLIFLFAKGFLRSEITYYLFKKDAETFKACGYNNFRIIECNDLLLSFKALFQMLKWPFLLVHLRDKNFKNISISSLYDAFLVSVFEVNTKNCLDHTKPPGTLENLVTAFSLLKIYFKSRYFLQKYKNCKLFVGHMQYHYRLIAAAFLYSKSPIFAMFANEYGHLNDLSVYVGKWNTPTISNSQLNESRDIMQVMSAPSCYQKYKVKFNNIIYVPVFGDLPFYKSPQKRLFSGYSEWLKETIKLINESQEIWTIKTHPLAQWWGENSKQILFDFINKYSTKDNIHILESEQELSLGNRVISYSGTIALEAASLGIRSIVIQDSYFTSIFKNYAVLPGSLEEYGHFILEPSSNLPLLLSENASSISKSFLNEMNKPFDKDLDQVLSIKHTFPSQTLKGKHLDELINQCKSLKFNYL